MVGPSRAEHPDETAAVRTLLELVAELMEESFAVMGEGQILGTMPAYLERFGAGNARYIAHEYLASDHVRGPRSALSPMALVSHVTATDHVVEEAPGGILKRLLQCEFKPAFERRGPFPRAMMCTLHCAAYQGSVNGLVDPEEGFDVQVTKRILFGDRHCDFLVQPRSEPEPDDAMIPMSHVPGQKESQQLAYDFYTFLLTSFVDYVSHHLEQDVVEDMLRRVAARVGIKVRDVMARSGMAVVDAARMGQTILLLGGRELGDGLEVTFCPQAAAIRSTATGQTEQERQRVRGNACRLCKNLVAGAVRDVDPMARVYREQSLALGDEVCDYKVTHGD